MATQTRFEGSVNLRNLPEVRRVAPLMSDSQLTFFFKSTKMGGLREANEIFKNELAARILDVMSEGHAVLARDNATAAANLRKGVVK